MYMFLVDTRPTYKTNVLVPIYVEKTFMFNVICNVFYYKNFYLLVFVICILSIVRLQPLDMHGFPGRKRLCC